MGKNNKSHIKLSKNLPQIPMSPEVREILQPIIKKRKIAEHSRNVKDVQITKDLIKNNNPSTSKSNDYYDRILEINSADNQKLAIDNFISDSVCGIVSTGMDIDNYETNSSSNELDNYDNYSTDIDNSNDDFSFNLMTDCVCYDDYRDENIFFEKIIRERRTYAACIAYENGNHKIIMHRIIPINYGTYLDYRIRGRKVVEENRSLWGLVILNGMPKVNSPFSTYDSLNLHPRENNTEIWIEWFMYVYGEGLALHYKNKIVSVVFKQQRYTNCDENPHIWLELVNQANPFVRDQKISANRYIEMFDKILEYPYDMNDLKHRQFLNPKTILTKCASHLLAKNHRKKNYGSSIIRDRMSQGVYYDALSKNNNWGTEEWCKNYSQNLDNSLHDGRSNKVIHYLCSVTKANNNSFNTTESLEFAKDAPYFLDPINTSTLKSVGEQNVLADGVTVTEESDPMAVFKYIKKYALEKNKETHIILINAFFTNIKMEFDFSAFYHLKRNFPHITTKYFPPYINISTKDSIPIKFNDKFKIFLSPFEVEYHKIDFPEGSLYSYTAKILDNYGLIKNPPAKSTVAINNIKGSIANLTSKSHQKLMDESLGVVCYMEINDEIRKKIINSALLSVNEPVFWEYFADIRREFSHLCKTIPKPPENINDLDMGYLKNLNNLLIEPIALDDLDKDELKESLNFLYNKYDMLKEFHPTKITSNASKKYQSYEMKICPENEPLVDDYLDMLLCEKNYEPPSVWNFKAWVAFGEYQGYCILDGAVFDTDFVKSMPIIVYNSCLSIDFNFTNFKQLQFAHFIPIIKSKNLPESLIGLVITDSEVYVKYSRHCVVSVVAIGNHYYNFIHFLPIKQNGLYHKLETRCIKKNKQLILLINCKYYTMYSDGDEVINSFGVGIKIANSFGQKNVCSHVCDLSEFYGITRSGKKIKPQILQSPPSIVSRMSVGQILSMLNSETLALGPNKEIIALLDISVHNLHSRSGLKIFKMRNDTLSNVNGYDSQAITTFNHLLRTEPINKKVMQLIRILGFAVKPWTLPFKNDTSNNTNQDEEPTSKFNDSVDDDSDDDEKKNIQSNEDDENNSEYESDDDDEHIKKIYVKNDCRNILHDRRRKNEQCKLLKNYLNVPKIL